MGLLVITTAYYYRSLHKFAGPSYNRDSENLSARKYRRKLCHLLEVWFLITMPTTRFSTRAEPNSSTALTANAPKPNATRKKPKSQAVSRVEDSATENTEKIQFITSMPLDVLLVIFILLQPQDVLRLSCTSKAVRAFLMSPIANHVWTYVSATILERVVQVS